MKEKKVKIFEKIYEKEADAIFRFCLTKVSDREQALDITQETFLRLWQSLAEEREILNDRAFLFTVARRLVIDWYRKKKSVSLDDIFYGQEEQTYEISDEMTTGHLLLGVEGRYLLDKIDEITSVNREAVYLRFIEDLSPSEIGEILGISTNNASVRINRGLMELREKFGYDDNKR